MHNRIVDFFTGLARGRAGRHEPPAAAVERLLREMNRSIPSMAETVGRLHERIRGLERERLRLENSAPGAGRLSALERQLAAAQSSHAEALRSMNDYIEGAKRELARNLDLLKDDERAHEEHEIQGTMRRMASIGTAAGGTDPARPASAMPGESAADAHAWEGRLEEGRAKARRIGDMAHRAAGGVMRDRILGAAQTAGAIIDYLAGHPERIAVARQFVSYYLDAALNILEGYLELRDSGGASAEVRESLGDAESALADIERAFAKILEKIMEQDLINLDVEIAVLQKAIKADNLS